MISRRAIEDGRLDPAPGQLEQERLGIDHLGQTPGPGADATIEGPQAGLRSHRTGRHARPVDRAHHYHLRGRSRPPTKLHPDGTDRADDATRFTISRKDGNELVLTHAQADAVQVQCVELTYFNLVGELLALKLDRTLTYL